MIFHVFLNTELALSCNVGKTMSYTTHDWEWYKKHTNYLLWWLVDSLWHCYTHVSVRTVYHVSCISIVTIKLVGGFNPSEKYESIGMIISKIWKNKGRFQTTDQKWSISIHDYGLWTFWHHQLNGTITHIPSHQPEMIDIPRYSVSFLILCIIGIAMS